MGLHFTQVCCIVLYTALFRHMGDELLHLPYTMAYKQWNAMSCPMSCTTPEVPLLVHLLECTIARIGE